MGPPGQPWSRWSGFWGGLPFLALVQAVTVAVHLEDMNVVGYSRARHAKHHVGACGIALPGEH